MCDSTAWKCWAVKSVCKHLRVAGTRAQALRKSGRRLKLSPSSQAPFPFGTEATAAQGAVLEVQLGGEGGVTLLQLPPYLRLEQQNNPLPFVCKNKSKY